MGLYDADSTMSTLGYAADDHNITGDQPSFFNDVGNLVTKGAPLAALAAANSVVNTAIEIGNVFEPDEAKMNKISVHDEVGDGDLNDYYDKHSAGIEAAGLIAGSLVPGTLGIKALKLAQAGEVTGAIGKGLGFFNTLKTSAVAAAEEDIAAGSAGQVGGLMANKIKAIVGGIGDNALQGMAYEAATVMSMHASPLLDDMSAKDVGVDMLHGALLQGGIGGAIEGLSTLYGLRKLSTGMARSTTSAEPGGYSLDRMAGAYNPGDRAADLVSALSDIPEQSNQYGRIRAERAVNTSWNNVGQILGQMMPEDAGLGNDIVENLLKPMVKNATGTSDLADKASGFLAGLHSFTRITDDAVPEGMGDPSTFFFGKLGADSNLDFNNLITKDNSLAQDGRAYRVSNPNAPISIGKFSDTVDWAGQSVRKYDNSATAFADGHDIFINDKLQTVVNPKGNVERAALPNMSRPLNIEEYKSLNDTGALPDGSKPLLGGQLSYGSRTEGGFIPLINKPLITNVKTGAITEDAIPVVGDHGAVTIDQKGINYGVGDKQSRINMSVDGGFSPAIGDNISSSARYAWANKYDFRYGDTVAADDIPLLEKLYRDGTKPGVKWEDYSDGLAAKGISIDDIEMPASSADMLSHIQFQKNTLLHDLSSEYPSMSSEELGIHANVNEKYIDPQVSSITPPNTDMLLPDPNRFATLNHVKTWYDIGNIQSKDGMVASGMRQVAYRSQLISNAANSALSNFVGPFGGNLNDFIARSTALDSDTQGVGAKFFSASRAAYGTLAEQAERIGRSVSLLTAKLDGADQRALSPVAVALRTDKVGAAEASAYRDALRSTGHQYMEMPAELIPEHFPDLIDKDTGAITGSVRVLKDSISAQASADGSTALSWDKTYIPAGIKEVGSGELGPQQYYQLGQTATDWWNVHRDLNDQNILSRNNINMASGIARKLETGFDYAPPIDTNKYAHFALIKPKQGLAINDGGTHIIVAKDAESLVRQTEGISDRYDIFYKNDIADHHMALGDYQYDRNFAQSRVNADMAREGKLSFLYPDNSAETLINDFVNHHTTANRGLLRDHVEIANGDLFADLKARSDQYTAAQESVAGGNKVLAKINSWYPNDPYGSYLKTMLNISPKESYKPWSYAQDQLELFADRAFNAVRNAFGASQKGLLSLEDAGKVWDKFGISTGYKEATDMYSSVANMPPPTRTLSSFISKSNAVMTNGVITYDAFQQLLHAITSPMMALHEASSSIKELMSIDIPGSMTAGPLDATGAATTVPKTMPSVTKVAIQAVRNMFDPAISDRYGDLYRAVNDGRLSYQIEKNMQALDHISLPSNPNSLTEEVGNSKIKSALGVFAEIAGAPAKFVEAGTNWLSADIGRQLMEAAGKSGQELEDGVNTFVNRVKGNIIAGQRPVAFQGPLGQAIGLFQTYQFNVLQRLFKNVAEGDTKSVAVFAGLQSTLFGMQSLPGFKMINDAVGNANGNPQHKDMYNMAGQVFGNQLGKWMLYGSVSNVLNASMFTRADSNPRNLTLLPINPMDYPAISGGVRLAGSLWNMGQKIADGGNPGTSFMEAVEHNGVSRPLQGLAQLAQGYSTESSGKLISKVYPNNTMGLSELYDAGVFARLSGSRPLDEAVVLEDMYRSNLYKAKDLSRISALGEAVRSTFIGGGTPTPDQVNNFMQQYANTGGNINAFSGKLAQWSMQGNASAANEVYKHMYNSRSQGQIRVMGGTPLPDYRNSGFSPATADGEDNY